MATWSTVLWGEAQKGLLGLLNFPPFYQLPRAFCGYRMGGEFGDYSLQGPCTKLQTQTTWQYMTTCILSEKDGRLLKNAKLYACENLRNMVWWSGHDWPWKCFIPAALVQQAFWPWHAPWRKFNDLQACTSNPCHPSFWSRDSLVRMGNFADNHDEYSRLAYFCRYDSLRTHSEFRRLTDLSCARNLMWSICGSCRSSFHPEDDAGMSWWFILMHLAGFVKHWSGFSWLVAYPFCTMAQSRV